MSFDITVNNISTRASDQKITRYFELAGPILHKEIRRSDCKVWASFKYAEVESAEIACRMLDRTCLEDREIRISMSEHLKQEGAFRAMEQQRRREDLATKRSELLRQVKAQPLDVKRALLAKFHNEQEKQPQRFRLLLSESREMMDLLLELQQELLR